jgi:iron-sulfur cluster insertion protein
LQNNIQTEMPMPLVFTDSAAAKVADLIAEEGNPDLKLRVFVQGGGCSGFQYGFTFDEITNDDDTVMTKNGVSLLIDAMSYQYLVGAEIDYKEDLQGAQFVIKNPERHQHLRLRLQLLDLGRVDGTPTHGRPGRPLCFAGPAFHVAQPCVPARQRLRLPLAAVAARAARWTPRPRRAASAARRCITCVLNAPPPHTTSSAACGPWRSSSAAQLRAVSSASVACTSTGANAACGARAASSQARLNRSRPVLLGGICVK